MKQVNGSQIIEVFEKWAPPFLAMEGDPVGLHIGQLNRPVEKVLVTLDVNEEVIDEAIAKGANLIIAHHPPLYRPMKRLQTDTPQGRMIAKCVKNEVAVYAAHTNLDVAVGGVNDLLADHLHLQKRKVLSPTYTEVLYKLAVFCPVEAADSIRHALALAGAGAIGDYEACSYSVKGEGRFTPNTGAEPAIGVIGEPSHVEEEKIEVIVPDGLKKNILRTLFQAHPYEEPAYDLIQLAQDGQIYGLGRIGELTQPVPLRQFAEQVKKAFQVPALRFVGDPAKPIRKVAVLGGDGNKYIAAAKRSGADVLVTGDLYYHVAQEAEEQNLAVIDPGHTIEKVMIEGVVQEMTTRCFAEKYQVQFIPSTIHTEPFKFLI